MAGKNPVQSYRDLEVYQISFEGAVTIHEMTLRLPKYELYETGSQIRRSARASRRTSPRVSAAGVTRTSTSTS